ncbi:hypothetical protein GUJ93_ZPchr0006g43828 [Zizania palustris]|uniref:Uncharacterized protein n=1 Tax=Zizania palustris TaxID=103762 RepID=A0A8J5VIY7_ZIZPA|nr:hypothetical protein GUJ93_ZPchr0006g43828 [Zizania palustris]
MPATAEVVVAEEVAAPPLGSPGDSGAEFLQMFEYTSSPVQSPTSTGIGTLAEGPLGILSLVAERAEPKGKAPIEVDKAANLRYLLADSQEKASNLEDALQQEQGRWAAFEVEAKNVQTKWGALVAEVQKLQAQKAILEKRTSKLTYSNSKLKSSVESLLAERSKDITVLE